MGRLRREPLARVRATLLARCAGAPRDLGLDQGRACRDEIRADARAQGWIVATGFRDRFRALRRDDVPARIAVARDVTRHFPHLAERVLGLAAGAGVASAALFDALLRELDGSAEGALHCEGGAAGDALELRIASPWPLSGFVVRHCTPDGGYPNLSFARPAHVAGLAGVNDRGLAGVAVPLAAPATDERCAAPGLLLLDQCIERLDSVEKALDWCEHRPGGGRALLSFRDAAGNSAALEIDGEKRQRHASTPIGGMGLVVRADPQTRTLTIGGAGVEAVCFSLDAAS